MSTRFAASCTNLDPLNAFGPTAEKQFVRKSRKYNIDVEDLRQDACLVYFEKNHLYDATKGTRRAYLWAHLEKRSLRQVFGPLRYPIYLDDYSETARFILEQLEMEQEEENDEYQDIRDSEILDNAILEKCRKFALSISGKSVRELANLWGVSKRRVHQIIAEWCTIARTERLRTSK